MDVGHTRAWARGRRSGPISTICRRRWQHDNATRAVALLQSGCALPARGHGPGETYLSTGGKATYRNRNAVAGNRATSPVLVQKAGMEWAWRLAQNPKRLWRRYLVDDPAILRLLWRGGRGRGWRGGAWEKRPGGSGY